MSHPHVYRLTPAAHQALGTTPPAVIAPDEIRCLDGASRGPDHWCPNVCRTGELFCETHDPNGRWHLRYTNRVAADLNIPAAIGGER